MRRLILLCTLVLAAPLFAAPAHSATDITLPARGAFYYPWFPETWSVGSPPKHVFYHPVRGYYDSSDPSVVADHVLWLNHAKVDVGIASWWGQSPTDGHMESTRIPLLLNASTATPLKWALYYEKEFATDPTPMQVIDDLAYINDRYASRPEYASVGGRPVIFVYNAEEGCGVATKWVNAVSSAWYLVMKVFPGYAACMSQPDAWHQYGPAEPEPHHVTGDSYTISPGFWRADEAAPRLGRDYPRFAQDVKDMVASGEPWQLVTTFNEWGEGTAVEASGEWLWDYLFALATDGLYPGATEIGKKYVSLAGDIACPQWTSTGDPAPTKTAIRCHQLETSQLLHAELPPFQYRADLTLGLGDIQYDFGSASDYGTNSAAHGLNFNATWGSAFRDSVNCLPTTIDAACYHPSEWPTPGDFRLAVGNHEYIETPGDAHTYWANFGERVAGPEGTGYYAFNVGPDPWPNSCEGPGDGPCYSIQPYPWRVIVLNSNCGELPSGGAADGCAVGSPQYNWLAQELATSTAMCELAVMHHPPFSGGPNYENDPAGILPLYALMDAEGVDIVATGHEHNYQRFAPQDRFGGANPFSPRALVIGTGGRNHSAGVNLATPNLLASNETAFGIGRLELMTTGWQFRFISEGGTYSDFASGRCQVGGLTAGADTTPPTVPTDVQASAVSHQQVDVSWTASADNVGVDHYTVRRDGQVLTSSVSGFVTTYSDLTVQPSTTYSYTVEAFDAAGNASGESLPASATTPPAPPTQTFPPVADAYVNELSPTTNFGSSTALRADGSPLIRSYLRFVVTGVVGAVTQAKLRVFANSASAVGHDVHGVSDNTWGETTINYTNAPAFGSAIGSSGAFGAGVWTEVDVTPYVTGNGTYSMAMTTSSTTAINYASRDAAGAMPQLVVTAPAP